MCAITSLFLAIVVPICEMPSSCMTASDALFSMLYIAAKALFTVSMSCVNSYFMLHMAEYIMYWLAFIWSSESITVSNCSMTRLARTSDSYRL